MISKTRWKEAQEFELNDWKNEADIMQKEWDEAFKKFNAYFGELEQKLGVTENWKILDIGCNVTCVSRMIKEGEHIGVEPLADALDLNSKVEGITIHNGMGEDMPFLTTGSIDLAICRNVIDHTHVPEKVIDEVVRVLKPEGYFFLACYVYNPFITFVKNFGEAVKILRNVGHPHTYTMETLEDLVNKDFKIIDRKVIYEGVDPNDFGKIDENKGNLSAIQKSVMFVNDKVLRNKWFVREYSLLCQRI